MDELRGGGGRRKNTPDFQQAAELAERPAPDGQGMGALPDPPDDRDWDGKAALDRMDEAVGAGEPDVGASLLRAVRRTRDWHQLTASSCTSFGVNRCVVQAREAQGLPFRDPSMLATYAWTRMMADGAAGLQRDAGAAPRTAIQSTKQYGIAPEKLMPYEVSRVREKPNAEAEQQAELHQTVEYYALPDGDVGSVRRAINAGHLVTFAVPIHEGFAPDAKGDVRDPARGRLTGYHQMNLYRSAPDKLWGLNQWGPGWGQRGRFSLPDAFLLEAMFGCWFVTLSEDGAEAS